MNHHQEDMAQQVIPIRHKKINKISQPPTLQQQRDTSTTSSINSDQQPMINVARIQQAI